MALVHSAVALLGLCTGQPAKRSTSCRVSSQPSASLLRIGLAVPISVASLVALNVAQNGPEQPLALERVMGQQNTESRFEGQSNLMIGAGLLASGPFTPTDTAPESVEEVLTLRTKADMVRAWRNGQAPALPGANGQEVFDGAVLKRGILAPCSNFITHRLLGGGKRWRGKVFEADGHGCNRFGGTVKNRFGVTSSDAREIERLIREQVRYQKAVIDPPLREQIESSEGLSLEEGASRAADERAAAVAAASAAVASVGEEERRSLAFTARVDASRLDGRPALILEYSNKGTGAGDSFWGSTLGMRDELREVAPGVLLGLGSLRAFGGVRNCAPFVLVRADSQGS